MNKFLAANLQMVSKMLASGKISTGSALAKNASKPSKASTSKGSFSGTPSMRKAKTKVAEAAKIIAARMPEPFDVRKGNAETFKKVTESARESQDQ